MPANRIVTPRRWHCLLAWGLAAIFALAAPTRIFSADPAKFAVPIQIGGITYEGVGEVATDGSIVVTVRIVYRQSVPGPGPVIVDPPKPDPKPHPSKVVAIYVVHESGDDTPAFAAIRNNASWKQEAEKAGIRWLVVDQDTAKTKLPQAMKLAVAKGLPAVVIIDANGLGVAEKCPDVSGMLALVRKAGGK